jgi:hypothetical protein
METLLHPEKCMVWCALSISWAFFFFWWYCDCRSLSPCPPRRISSIYRRNVCQFQINVFFYRTGLCHTLWIQCWMCSVSILTGECCLFIFLNSLDMGGPGHHTLLAGFNPWNDFLWGFLKDTACKTNPHRFRELKQEILTAMISITIHFKLSAAQYYIKHPGKDLTINKSVF